MELAGGSLGIAALITWVVAALGGFYMLGVWLSKGGARRQGDTQTLLRPPVVFSHFLLAAAGLVVWIIYLLTDAGALAWVAFAVVVVVALLGFSMFVPWLSARRVAYAAKAGAPDNAATPESGFPMAVVLAHGALAAATVVLVILTALELGGS